MPTNVYAYKPGSRSARALADALEVRLISHTNSRYRGSPEKVIINWGASTLPPALMASHIINHPEKVSRATNKLTFFQTCGDSVRTPEWTTEKAKAATWGEAIVVRKVLTGHSGAGIVIGDVSVDAPLYTKYVKKAAEYRIHFAFGEPIDVQRKIKDPNREVSDWAVRNHDNGFIFVRNDVKDKVPSDVWGQAASAVKACALDFGACDVIWNEKEQRAYVLEINSAPGLEGQTVTSYANAFRKHFRDYQ